MMAKENWRLLSVQEETGRTNNKTHTKKKKAQFCRERESSEESVTDSRDDIRSIHSETEIAASACSSEYSSTHSISLCV